MIQGILMDLRLLALLAVAVLLAGCCTTATPAESGSCPYGTYGSSCTAVCDKTSQDPNCFTTCMDQVRGAGLGDATTCCKTSVQSKCQDQCNALASRTQGDTTASECMDECTATYNSVGIPLDSCGDIPY